MPSCVPRAQASAWLLENGPKQLELLFRAIVYHPSVPILIVDSERNYRDASAGAGELLGLSRDRVIGQKIDDFADSTFRPRISELWRAFLSQANRRARFGWPVPMELRGTEYMAKGDVLPVRHLLVLHDRKTSEACNDQLPSWVQDYALFLLDVNGQVASWHSGAARICGYTKEEATGKHVSFLYPAEEAPGAEPQRELSRSAAESHFGNEGRHVRKDGSRFWANVVTMALRDENGDLQGFARVVRDFSERHERDDKLQRSRTRVRPVRSESTIAGIVSGEFDHIPEATTPSLDWWGTAVKIYWRAGFTGPSSPPRKNLLSTIWRMKEA